MVLGPASTRLTRASGSARGRSLDLLVGGQVLPLVPRGSPGADSANDLTIFRRSSHSSRTCSRFTRSAPTTTAALLLPPAAGYPKAVTLDQWLAVQFQEQVVVPLFAAPPAVAVVVLAAAAGMFVRVRRLGR